MVHIPVSEAIARKISDKAVQICRQDLQGRGWKSARSLIPFAKEGQVGIQTSVRYLMHQEKGIKPFLMKWVEGRTIGMSCPQGDGPHFRKGSHVGEPGYVDIPHKGKVWRESRWRHPGLKPKNFMHDAIQQAIKESHGDIKQDILRALRGEYT